MIKVILLTIIVGLTTAQYGHGGSGYGPDGVRNRYFILGHGRPVTGSVGRGIYGPSVSQGSYSSAPSYRPAEPAYSAPAYSAPAPPRPVSYAPAVSHGSYGNGGSSGYGAGASSYGGHGSGYGSAAHSYAPAAPSYVHAAPAPSYAPAAPAPRYAPAVRSYSAPAAVGHGLYGPSASQGYSAPAKYGHHDDLAQPTPYDFGYNVHNEHGDQLSRQETGDGHGNVKGSYGYRDSYGIYRHVDYVADHDGFRANVKTNEPGTAPQDPADVHLEVEHGYGY